MNFDLFVWNLFILGLDITARTTLYQDLNVTSTMKIRREGLIMNPIMTSIMKSRRNEGLLMNPNMTSTVKSRRDKSLQMNPNMITTVKSRRDEGPLMPPRMPEEEPPTPKSNVGHVNEAVHAAASRFTAPSSTTKKFVRTTPRRVSFTEDCDYLAHYCLKAYDTGVLCGRTIYYKYHTFKNYCLLDYVNCMERYEVWQVVHMGECFTVKELTEYVLYPYDDDFFLDQYYIVEDN